MKTEYSEKINKYLNGKADAEEKKQVENWFFNGEKDNDLRNILENEWNLLLDSPVKSEADLNSLLNRLHHSIRIKEQENRKTLTYRFTQAFMKAAAVLFLPLLVSGGLLFHYINRVHDLADQQVVTDITVPMGARVFFSLPDGTTGVLNSGSVLTYSMPFNKQRNVSLSGEGWFDVSHDKNNPFNITAGNSKITVLGTKFNLCAYPDEEYTELVLEEGKVEFYSEQAGKTVTLNPSERLICRKNEISTNSVDPVKYSAWKEGKLIFRGDPMAEVARRIERWYNVKVELSDKELEKYSFRATFEDDKLEDVLNFLSMTSPIKYLITERKMLPDGTYEKENVIINLK